MNGIGCVAIIILFILYWIIRFAVRDGIKDAKKDDNKRIIEERLMEIINKNIDDGTPFDCGRTSSDYAKYRDIYPELFYDKIINRQLCITGQDVLDLVPGQRHTKKFVSIRS